MLLSDVRRTPLWLTPPTLFIAGLVTVVVLSWLDWHEPIDWRLAFKVAVISGLFGFGTAMLKWVARRFESN